MRILKNKTISTKKSARKSQTINILKLKHSKIHVYYDFWYNKLTQIEIMFYCLYILKIRRKTEGSSNRDLNGHLNQMNFKYIALICCKLSLLCMPYIQTRKRMFI